MASIGDDEAEITENTGRRTRSGRRTSAPLPPPVKRNTRRSKKNPQPEIEPEEHEKSLSENEQNESENEHETTLETINESDPTSERDISNELDQENEQNHEIEDEKSSSFPFGDIPSEITSIYEQSSVDKEDVDNSFFANLAAEENANSLPSATDDVREDSREVEDTQDSLHNDKILEKNNIGNFEKDEHMNVIDEMVNDEENNVEKMIEDKAINEITDNNIDKESVEINEETTMDDEPIRLEDIVTIDEAVDEGNSNELSTEKSNEENAIAEPLPNGDNSQDTLAEPDTEMVSEDELPVAKKPEVKDAEEVSDDELPGPKLAELPADTEVVSEDELPSSTKKDATKRKVEEDYDPGSPTESADLPEKKAKIDNEPEEKAQEVLEEEPEKKKLPDLDKYWKAVKDDAADFTGWTYLLQYVDQENDVDAAREAYDAFLAHYPYCYGYWRKYADYEKRKGNKKKCEEVFERGLKAIPLSVDLWIHYLAHVKSNFNDDEEFIREQFERALNACGLEFRSDKLWEAYIKWETEGKRISKIVKIYDKLLATPTQGYNNHFDSFQEIVNNNSITALIDIEEIKTLRAEVRELIEMKDKEKDIEDDIPPGAEEPDDHFRSEEEISAIKDKILSSRRKIHKQTVAAVTDRWTFEEGIKRPYFHVKPLERCQLKNWKEYLDFEIEKGDQKRVLVLFERCLIACALYDEFWLKLIRYLESQNNPSLEDVTRDAFERACTIHHTDKPSLHLMWSAFEELHNNFDKAAKILINIENVCPNLLQIAYRRINLERRRKDFSKCSELYEHYINQTKNKNIASSLAIKYARFTHKIKGEIDEGLNILKTALEKDQNNARLVLQMIDLLLQRPIVDENEVVTIIDNFISRDGMELDQKVLFAQRKVEFLEDFGSTAKGLQDAQRALQIALNKANEAKKKQSESSAPKKAKDSSQTTTQTGASSNYSNNYQYPNQSYYYGSRDQSSYFSDYTQQQWAPYSQYQWSGYGNYNY